MVLQTKRKQVRRACAPCAKAKRKCSGERPCPVCVWPDVKKLSAILPYALCCCAMQRCVETKRMEECVDVVTKAQMKRQAKSDTSSFKIGNGAAKKMRKVSETGREGKMNNSPTMTNESLPRGPKEGTTEPRKSSDNESNSYTSESVTKQPESQIVYESSTGDAVSILFNKAYLSFSNMTEPYLRQTLENKRELYVIHPDDAELHFLAECEAAVRSQVKYSVRCRYLRTMSPSQRTFSGQKLEPSDAHVEEVCRNFPNTAILWHRKHCHIAFRRASRSGSVKN